MLTAIIICFILGYVTIVFEHPLKLDKTVPALLMGSLCWALMSLGFHSGSLDIIDTHEHVFSLANGVTHEAEEGFVNALLHHLGKTAEILVFLIGAMTIVEIIDLHRGFENLKNLGEYQKQEKAFVDHGCRWVLFFQPLLITLPLLLS